MLEYRDTVDEVTAEQLAGFFGGWPNPPTAETHLSLLRRADAVVVAIDSRDGSVAGFVTVLTDGILSAYIPLLEVRPEFRGGGVGRALVTRLLRQLDALYMVDVLCDAEVLPFYERLGFTRAMGACKRRYESQPGRFASSRG